MEIIYNAFNFFKTNGFMNLHHIIEMSHDIDMEDLYWFYEKEKENKEIIDFMNHYQNEYGLKTIIDTSIINSINGIIYKLGTLSTGECIICYDENEVGFKTPCSHFMCMECCVKLFKDDNTIEKCPYCREYIVLYKMNEIIKKFKNNEFQVDHRDKYVFQSRNIHRYRPNMISIMDYNRFELINDIYNQPDGQQSRQIIPNDDTSALSGFDIENNRRSRNLININEIDKHFHPATRRQNSRSQIKNKNTIRNITKHGNR